jgi:hypothetical protein
VMPASFLDQRNNAHVIDSMDIDFHQPQTTASTQALHLRHCRSVCPSFLDAIPSVVRVSRGLLKRIE